MTVSVTSSQHPQLIGGLSDTRHDKLAWLVVNTPKDDNGEGSQHSIQREESFVDCWSKIDDLREQAFRAATAGYPVSNDDWCQRNALINRIALVCRGWWLSVAPADGKLDDRGLHRRISSSVTVEAAAMRPWWSVVRANEFVTDAAICALAAGCPGLKSVDLSTCYELTDVSISALADGCPGLTIVDLSGCKQLSDASISALAAGCPELTSLDLSYCYELSDASISALVARCPELTNVNLSYCYDLTDASISALAAGCPGLTSVSLSNWYHLTDAAISALAARCPGLTSVNLSGCNKLTTASISALKAGCPGLA